MWVTRPEENPIEVHPERRREPDIDRALLEVEQKLSSNPIESLSDLPISTDRRQLAAS